MLRARFDLMFGTNKHFLGSQSLQDIQNCLYCYNCYSVPGIITVYTGSGRSSACLSVVGRVITWV